MRISINSFQDKFYNAYYRPKGYALSDVLKSIKTSKKSGLYVSLNLLVFPGLTDTPKEVEHLIKFLECGYIDLVQMRNLNIDNQFYLDAIPVIKEKGIGIQRMLEVVRKVCSKARFGYFNLPKERFSS